MFQTLPGANGQGKTGGGLCTPEGRQRQVRKMFDAIGHPVVRLKRVRIGPIEDPVIPPGHWRDLTPEEVSKLQRSTGLAAPARRAHSRS